MGTNEEHEMPGNPRDMITVAERRFPVRIRIGVPPGGFGQRYAQITAWLDENCGADGWAMTPSGMRGVLNDAMSIYFLDATLASAFVARWCAGYKVETTDVYFMSGTMNPCLGSEQGCIGRHSTRRAPASETSQSFDAREVRLAGSSNAPDRCRADRYRLCRHRQPRFRQKRRRPLALHDESLRRASADWLCRPSATARVPSENGQPNTRRRQ